MSDKKIPYTDKIAPNIPDWYAEIKYFSDKTARENYLDNALNPYRKAYSFYTMRDNMRLQQLEIAAKMERLRQAKIKDKQKKKKWREKVKVIL